MLKYYHNNIRIVVIDDPHEKHFPDDLFGARQNSRGSRLILILYRYFATIVITAKLTFKNETSCRYFFTYSFFSLLLFLRWDHLKPLGLRYTSNISRSLNAITTSQLKISKFINYVDTNKFIITYYTYDWSTISFHPLAAHILFKLWFFKFLSYLYLPRII